MFSIEKLEGVNQEKGFDSFWFKCYQWNFLFQPQIEKKKSLVFKR